MVVQADGEIVDDETAAAAEHFAGIADGVFDVGFGRGLDEEFPISD